MSDKRHHIAMVTLPSLAQQHPDMIVSSICGLGDSFFARHDNPHRHDFYAMYWIKSGSLRLTIDAVIHDVGANTLLFVAPGQVYQMQFSGKLEGYLVAFQDGFLCLKDANQHSGINSSLFFNAQFSSVISLEASMAPDFEWLVQRMMREIVEQQPEYQLATHGLLRYLLVLASRLQAATSVTINDSYSPHYNGLFLQFKQLIEEKFRILKNVSEYADLLHIKPVQLNEISKQLSGITAGEHIRNRIILEAQRYLFNTDLSAKEIAYQLGFEDPHYFSRFFKKYTNQRPSEFKELSKVGS
ncbi:AraC-type DNA-binding protein [Chitinophaga costaii]|uniref:AraC-type DNA-binding protein n=1 Tax=Chitinophaga costaii TaxID=1335309 RepID=A0A1C4DRV8_9BACT|nr:helix-turn-helix domain-containing protein [Chitinophaga costaii]SCC34079.1 AraC-type DNA-binding protein [Chitinophaga costaii]